MPGVYAKNKYGKSIYQTTSRALADQERTNEELEKQKPKSAPDMGVAKLDQMGQLAFKPSSFLFQKRMQGEWNNGRLGTRNMSAIKFDDRNHWGSSLLKTTNKDMFEGHTMKDVPPQYSKYPQPMFQNMDAEQRHASMYQGYLAL